jgi:hypothetical protein
LTTTRNITISRICLYPWQSLESTCGRTIADRHPPRARVPT